MRIITFFKAFRYKIIEQEQMGVEYINLFI